jgi:cytidine deaminase
MSLNPFTADPAIRERYEALSARAGPQIAADIAARIALRRRNAADNLGSVLLAAEAAEIIAAHGLTGIEDLMLLALSTAREIARPPISDFFVGAVGLERETGNLIFGGNVEFPGTHLGFTVHGEGFVFTRAFSRGTSIAAIAIGEAHPCAHCRQYLSEFAATRDLVLVDPLGHRLTMAQLYPWPFDPGYLGEAGAVAGTEYWPQLSPDRPSPPSETAERLVAAGRRAYSPYSKCPGAVILTLRDGSLVAGTAIESVAYNPTMGPLQAALIDLLAHGYEPSDIANAALGTVQGGSVDYSEGTRELLGRVAPQATLNIVAWTV